MNIRTVQQKKHFYKHLTLLTAIKRHKHHPLIHHIHKKYNLSKKTLFYIKEYGPHSHIVKNIISESIGILIFASILSAFGGVALEEIKSVFIAVMPLVILLPTMNDMIGGYGAIISSRFSTMLHEDKLHCSPWKDYELIRLFLQVLIISTVTSILSAAAALLISEYYGYKDGLVVAGKVMLIAVINTLMLMMILFTVSILAGTYYFAKKEDPNNFLIPITTSIADFGNMLILMIVVLLLF